MHLQNVCAAVILRIRFRYGDLARKTGLELRGPEGRARITWPGRPGLNYVARKTGLELRGPEYGASNAVSSLRQLIGLVLARR